MNPQPPIPVDYQNKGDNEMSQAEPNQPQHRNNEGTDMTDYTPTDSLRYLTARGLEKLDYVIDRLGWSLLDGLTESETEDLTAILEGIKIELSEHLSAHTDRWPTYDDGRRVKSAINMETGWTYEHVWHPDRANSINQPHVAIPNAECSSGTRRSVLVTAGENLAVHPRCESYPGEEGSYSVAEAARMLEAMGWTG